MADKMQNINLNIDTRKKFTVDGNPNKVIELDVTDVGIISRYKESIPMIDELSDNYERIGKLTAELQDIRENTDISEDEAAKRNSEKLDELSAEVSELERKMRDIIDFIFDSKICDIILENTSVFSPVNGKNYKYEVILEVLANLYSKSISSDIQKINKANVRKHAAKYTRK